MVTTVASPAEAGRGESLGDALRRIPPLLPVYVVVLAVTTGIGLLIANVLARVTAWDTDVVRELAASRTDLIDTLTGYGTWLAESAVSIAILFVAMVIARLVSHAWTLTVFLAVAVGSEKLIYLLSSLIVDRGRPPVPTVGETYATASFPSGHVGTAISLYGSIALVVGVLVGSRALGRGLLVAAAVIGAVVAYCRMYRGFHFPTDVIIGAAVGTVCLAIAWLGIGRYAAGPGRRRDPERGAQSPGVI